MISKIKELTLYPTEITVSFLSIMGLSAVTVIVIAVVRSQRSQVFLNFHVCTVHQPYQNTFLLIQLMHTIIKSQEC